MSDPMTVTDLVAEARELLSAAAPGPWEERRYYFMDGEWMESSVVPVEDGDFYEEDGACVVVNSCTADAELIAAAPRLLAALADEVERLRAEPTEADIEAAAEAITAHSTLSHPCEGGERCCDECGEAFGWHGIDRTEEGHRYAIHRARKALAAAQEVRSHDRQDTGVGDE